MPTVTLSTSSSSSCPPHEDHNGLEVLPFLTFTVLLMQFLANGAYSINNNNNNNDINNNNNNNDNNNVNKHNLRVSNNNTVDSDMSTSTIIIGGRDMEGSWWSAGCSSAPQQPHVVLDLINTRGALLGMLAREGARLGARGTRLGARGTRLGVRSAKLGERGDRLWRKRARLGIRGVRQGGKGARLQEGATRRTEERNTIDNTDDELTYLARGIIVALAEFVQFY
ncbi:hypothetical protein Pmani_017925 [Petrolisthes manimaculis]|uniref:Uncharacterized protein n=1 Tax=Petrolisthes manimaculis TaxID=1843537 RepID=A0AAE1PNQ5_9EUCA|nr:hypothetical protein Pmani_017925 [Petrolisthes manimaculis]